MSEIIVKIILFKEGEIDRFDAKVHDLNYKVIRKRLELEREKITDVFRDFKENDIIKGISKPRNKKMQKQLNIMIEDKCILTKSIKKIKVMFY